MYTELETAPPTSQMAGNSVEPSQPVRQAQPQPSGNRLESILAKQARGESLTRAEAGYLGSQRRRKQPVVAPATNPNPLLEQAAEAPAPADNPLLAPSPSNPVASEPVVATAVDNVRLREVADTILSSLDTATQFVVGYQAEKIPGVGKPVVEKYKSAVALKDGNRKLIVENSEPMVLAACKFFKCSPEQLESVLKNSGFLGGIFMHCVGVSAALKSIKESRTEAEQSTAKPKPA